MLTVAQWFWRVAVGYGILVMSLVLVGALLRVATAPTPATLVSVVLLLLIMALLVPLLRSDRALAVSGQRGQGTDSWGWGTERMERVWLYGALLMVVLVNIPGVRIGLTVALLVCHWWTALHRDTGDECVPAPTPDEPYPVETPSLLDDIEDEQDRAFLQRTWLPFIRQDEHRPAELETDEATQHFLHWITQVAQERLEEQPTNPDPADPVDEHEDTV